MKRFFGAKYGMTVSVVLAALLFSLPAFAEYDLRVLHTNDVHSRVESVSKYNNNCSPEKELEGKCFGGYARIATAVKQVRDTGTNVLLVDGGDQFQGSMYYTTYKGQLAARIMNMIGYNAMVIGNHEFDDGPAALAAFIKATDFPVLGANIDATSDSKLKGLIKAYAIFRIGGEKVGVFGLTTPETKVLASPGKDVHFMDEVPAARYMVKLLRSKGINKIIALTHSGLPSDLRLAANVDGIDVIVGGHDNTFMSNTSKKAVGSYPTVVKSPSGNPTLVVQAFAYSRYLGDLNVTFDDDGVPVKWKGEPIVLDSTVTPDPAILAEIEKYKGKVDGIRKIVVGEFTGDFDGDRKSCRHHECTMGDLVADAMLWKEAPNGAQIVIQNGGGIRASIPAGQVTMGDVLTVLPFQNALATFKLKGKDVVAALENGVSREEEEQGRFPQVAGIRFDVDLTQKPGNRVSNVRVADKGRWVPLKANQLYNVVTNDYMRKGGDGYSVFKENGMDAYDYGPNLENVVAEYIKLNSPMEPKLDGRINIIKK